MGLVLAMSIFFVIVTMIFIATALLLPEWMGITGSKAKEIIADHQQESAPAPDAVPDLDSEQKPS